MFVVFFVVCLVTRIVSDMVIVRRMVDDVLDQLRINDIPEIWRLTNCQSINCVNYGAMVAQARV